MNADQSSLSPRLWFGLGLALGVGAALRLAEFAALTPLDVDEAMLGLDIAARGYAGLLQTLDFGQTAPVLFLWGAHLATRLVGVGEPALRVLPFIAGVVLPWASWKLATRLLEPRAAVLAAAFTACAPILVRYSSVAKPYAIDALVTVMLVGLALDTANQPERARIWWRLLGAGVVALLASQPALFVLAGLTAALALDSRVRRVPGWLWRLGTAGVAWSGLFATLYFTLYRRVATDGYMRQFWAWSFLSPGSPSLVDRLPLIARETLFPFFIGSRPHTVAVIVVALALCGVGAVGLSRRLGRWAMVLVAGPVVAALAASTVHGYPIAARLMLYAAPLLMLMLAEGVVRGIAWLRRPGAARAAWVVVLAWLAVVAEAAATRRRPAPDVPSLVQLLRRAPPPATPVYVLANALPMWAFYSTDWAAPDTSRLQWLARLAGPGGPAFHNAPARGRPRADETTTLVGHWGARTEIIGLATGMQKRDLAGLARSRPDSGWVEEEVARIAAGGDHEVWLVLAFAFSREADELLAGLEAARWERVYERQAQDASLYRYRLRY